MSERSNGAVWKSKHREPPNLFRIIRTTHDNETGTPCAVASFIGRFMDETIPRPFGETFMLDWDTIEFFCSYGGHMEANLNL